MGLLEDLKQMRARADAAEDKDTRWHIMWAFFFHLPHDDLKVIVREVIADGDEVEYAAAKDAWREQTGAEYETYTAAVTVGVHEDWWSRKRD